MTSKNDLPGFVEKRRILYGPKATPEKLREAGRRFMDAARYDDALEFFSRCGADDLTRGIAQLAMDEGNVPLYMRAKKILREAIAEDEWTRIAASSEKAGRYSGAYVAHLKAGHEEQAAQARRKIPGAVEPPEPAPATPAVPGAHEEPEEAG